MNDKVYIVFRNVLGRKDVVSVFQIEENARAWASSKNRTDPVGFYTVEGAAVMPFRYCGRGPCWSPEGHAGDCMADE